MCGLLQGYPGCSKMIFCVIFALFLQWISGSRLVDTFDPVVGSDGKYDDKVVIMATEIVDSYLEDWAILKYHVDPASESFFKGAFDHVLLNINVVMGIIVPVVLENLIKSYTSLAYDYNRTSTLGTKSEKEIKTRAKKAMMCTILVQDGFINGFKFTQPQILIFLEFIYRFDTYGTRYGLAFLSLYKSIDKGLLSDAYAMIIDAFDPERITLPVFFIQSSELTAGLKDVFIDFILKLSAKVLLIDSSVEKGTAFSRHASMCISSMISCDFIDEFIPRISELLPRVDMIILVSSVRFSYSVIEQTKNSKDQPAAPLLELLCSYLIKDELIASLNPNIFVAYDSIILCMEDRQPALYKQHALPLSEEALNRLLEIRFSVIDYGIFQNLAESFAELETDSIELDQFELALSKVITFMPDYFEHKPTEAETFVTNLVQTIPKLVETSLRNDDKSLDVKRFVVLTQLLEITFTGPAIYASTLEAFAKVLLFFTSRMSETDDYDLKFAHIRCVDLIEKLVQANLFFDLLVHRSLLYKYFKIITPSGADNAMNNCFYAVLSSSDQNSAACLDIINTANKLKLNSNSVFSKWLAYEFEVYLSDFTHIPIELYQRGALLQSVNLIIKQKLIPKTEVILFESIFKKFSTNQANLIK